MKTPSVPTSAAQDPQVPVIEYDVKWIEIALEEEFIAYVLVAGANVTATNISTTKGTFAIQPGKEQYYSADKNVGSVSSADAITWRVLSVVNQEAGYAALIEAINGSVGLDTNTGNATPALTGDSDAVLWAQEDLPSGVTTFQVESKTGYNWQLSIEQANDEVKTLAWSTDDGTNNPTTTATKAPAMFGDDNSEVELEVTAEPSYDYVYDDYS